MRQGRFGRSSNLGLRKKPLSQSLKMEHSVKEQTNGKYAVKDSKESKDVTMVHGKVNRGNQESLQRSIIAKSFK